MPFPTGCGKLGLNRQRVVGAVSRKSIAWIAGVCGIAAVDAAVALLATGFFNAAQPVDFPSTLRTAEAGDFDDAPPAAMPRNPVRRHRAPPETALAERLLDGIPSGAKVALQPLDRPYAELEHAVGDPLYERILLALSLSDRLDVISARRAARDLARARVIAQALGLDGLDAPDVVCTEADAVAALGEYRRNGHVGVRLCARVVPVGASPPAVTALAKSSKRTSVSILAYQSASVGTIAVM